MKVYLKKSLNGFSPADEDSEKYHKKCKLETVYYFDVKKVKDQRNYKLLQKYWTMLGVAVENTETYRNKEDLHHDIKWALDITIVKQNMLTGEMMKEVGSVAFDKMENDEFNQYYSDSVGVVLSKVLKGVSEKELDNAVNEILGFA